MMEAQEHHAASPRGTSRKGHGGSADLLVMGTNNSSIVSKRSVERFYYPQEPHFFRFFVNKFQRRAPLINRGYHLRLHVIDVSIRDFLRRPSSKTKVIVNLGCGSDVIPWQCWTRYPDDCARSSAKFVDVDFPALVQKKRDVVLRTPELASHLSGVTLKSSDPHVILCSEAYYQVGIDLRQTAALEASLASIVDIRDCTFLFVAEVSITYMETDAADALIKWASTLGQAEFCLLEQILPASISHPFATTMLAHFEKLSTPIKSVGTYPTIPLQYSRFKDRGWSWVDARSLWSAWSDESFLTPEDRRRLDLVEPFDEHEEFALFASHYLLLNARNYGHADRGTTPTVPVPESPLFDVDTTYMKLTGHNLLRRNAGAMAIHDIVGNNIIINNFGLGHNNRLSSYDVYTRGCSAADLSIQSEGGPSSRMCFQLTDLGAHGTLLTGGRSSPAKAMADCWLFKNDSMSWKRTHDLPKPLYRHSACRLTGSSLVLVIGGKSGASGVSDSVFLFNPEKGWLPCNIGGTRGIKAVFGAILACTRREDGDRPVFRGVFAGGLLNDGTIDKQVLSWKVSFDDHQIPTIEIDDANVPVDETVRLLSRFGAVTIQDRDFFIVVGGVDFDGTIHHDNELAAFSTDGGEIQVMLRMALKDPQAPRPLLVGSSAVLTDNRELVIIGGAATCFSMGTFWTKGLYTVKLPSLVPNNGVQDLPAFRLSHSGEIVQARSQTVHEVEENSDNPLDIAQIPRVRLDSQEDFEKIIAAGLPAILVGLDMGSCVDKWSLDYVVDRLGEDRKVVVHESYSDQMDFNKKNFRYTTMSIGEFAKELQRGKRLYLRALSAEAPADEPANLAQDFPALAMDFVLPQQLGTCRDKVHSSILRVSGPVKMWLHYDVQANVYCQISGSRRMVLFPPTDVNALSLAPGASSSSIDIFTSLLSHGMKSTHPVEAELQPGDVLYIPPLWLHTAAPLTSVSIAVNVFFRSLETSIYSTGRDIYGNRDVAAYEKGRQDINKMANAFSKTPDACRQFYLLRLAEELAEKARS